MASQGTHESQMPFIRNLASSDRKLRTASLTSLQTFLSTRRTLTSTDALKLWKGLYYALWMTDRPKPQQALAQDLANLLFALPEPKGSKARKSKKSSSSSETEKEQGKEEDVLPREAWLNGFWAVMSAQWTDIDVLRMDKFLFLVRRVLAAHMRLVKSSLTASQSDMSASADSPDLVLQVLAEWPFDVECDFRRVPLGLRLHVLDIWVDEMQREGLLNEAEDEKEAGGDDAEKEGEEAFVRGVGDLVDALRGCPNKAVRERAGDSYTDGRLPWGTREDSDEEGEKAGGDEDEDMADGDEEDGWGGIED